MFMHMHATYLSQYLWRKTSVFKCHERCRNIVTLCNSNSKVEVINHPYKLKMVLCVQDLEIIEHRFLSNEEKKKHQHCCRCHFVHISSKTYSMPFKLKYEHSHIHTNNTLANRNTDRCSNFMLLTINFNR